MICHPFPPVYDRNSKVLILGSFPSVKSREAQFFYGHPQNRFWRVLAAVFNCGVPATVGEKRAFLLQHGVALWDVIASCEITGSSDASIRNVTVCDVELILQHTRIQTIFVNGKTAEKYYNRYLKPVLHRDAVCLPSTSSANAAWTIERLVDAWRPVRQITT